MRKWWLFPDLVTYYTDELHRLSYVYMATTDTNYGYAL